MTGNKAVNESVADKEETIPEDRSPFGRLALLSVYNTGNPLAHGYDPDREFILFSARNDEGHLLLGLLTDVGSTPSCLDRGRSTVRTERWLYAPVSDDTLSQLEAGLVDVARPFLAPDYGYLYELCKENGTISTVNRLFRDLPAHGIPDGVFLEEYADGGIFVSGISDKGRLVCKELLRNVQELRNEWTAQVVMSFEEAC